MGPLVEIVRSQPVHLTSCQNAFCDRAWGRRIVSLTMHHSPCTQCFQPLAWWAYIMNVTGICYHSNYIVFVVTSLPLNSGIAAKNSHCSTFVYFSQHKWNKGGQGMRLHHYSVLKKRKSQFCSHLLSKNLYQSLCVHSVYNGVYSHLLWHHTITSLIATSSDNCGTGQVLHSD